MVHHDWDVAVVLYASCWKHNFSAPKKEVTRAKVATSGVVADTDANADRYLDPVT